MRRNGRWRRHNRPATQQVAQTIVVIPGPPRLHCGGTRIAKAGCRSKRRRSRRPAGRATWMWRVIHFDVAFALNGKVDPGFRRDDSKCEASASHGTEIMADKKTFHLPDLGEGLPHATIVEWLVKEGDSVKLDAPLVSMETAKAVVEVPSPFTGKLLKQHGAAGDVINTGAPLAEFELDPKGKQRAENAAGGHHAPAQPTKGAGAPAPVNGDKVIASDEGGEIKKGGTA